MAEAKTKGDFSTVTPDGRAIVDLDQLFASDRIQDSLAVLDKKFGESPAHAPANSILHIR